MKAKSKSAKMVEDAKTDCFLGLMIFGSLFILAYIEEAYKAAEVGLIVTILALFGAVVFHTAAGKKEKALRGSFTALYDIAPWELPSEASDDAQRIVSGVIERKRGHAQDLFAQEEEIKAEEPVTYEALNDKYERLAELRKEIKKAKAAFWEACRIADEYGLETPKSINEAAAPSHLVCSPQ